MAEKSSKKKPKQRSDASVLGSLSPTRPTRLGGDRRAATTRAATTAATKPARTKPAKPTAKATKPKAKAAKPKTTSKPAATPPAGWQVPGEGDGRRDDRPGVVTTAVQAAGELAQIGVTVGGQFLKRAARRIPRP